MSRIYTITTYFPETEFTPAHVGTTTRRSFAEVIEAIAYNRSVRGMHNLPAARYTVTSSPA